MTRSQNARIAAHLLSGKTLTPLEALTRFGSFRLAARIRELKRDGMPIKTDMKHLGGRRFASYRLAS
jgi:hypothetical protein